MSRRETSLCDIPLSSYGGNAHTCGNLSIATCVLCTRDICTEHAMHPKGGLLLRADSISVNTAGGNLQDIIWSPSGSGQVIPYPQMNHQSPMIRLHLCAGCRRVLGDHEIAESIRELQPIFVKLLAAKMTERGLEAK
jgi:hypothetical protein